MKGEKNKVKGVLQGENDRVQGQGENKRFWKGGKKVPKKKGFEGGKKKDADKKHIVQG